MQLNFVLLFRKNITLLVLVSEVEAKKKLYSSAGFAFLYTSTISKRGGIYWEIAFSFIMSIVRFTFFPLDVIHFKLVLLWGGMK